MKYQFFIFWLFLCFAFLVSGCDPEKSLSLDFIYSPDSRESLIENIKREIASRGNAADLSTIDTSKVKDISGLFKGDGEFSNFSGDISSWDVSNITDMSSMFEGNTTFNGNISGWNVSNVTNMSNLFKGATSFNQNISGWNVSKVTDMSNMFEAAASFNQDISGWNVSKVTDMSNMFNKATVFQYDLEKWQVADSVNIQDIFKGANVPATSIPSWHYVFTLVRDGNSITDRYDNEQLIKSSLNVPLMPINIATSPPGITGTWSIEFNSTDGKTTTLTEDTGLEMKDNNGEIYGTAIRLLKDKENGIRRKYTIRFTGDGSYLGKSSQFSIYVSVFTAIVKTRNELIEAIKNTDVDNFNYINTSAVKDMHDLFKDDTTFNRDISLWDVSNVTDMSNMFAGATSFNGDISKWKVSNITDMDGMFSGASAFDKDLEGWNVASTVTKKDMFTNTAVAKLPTWYFSISANVDELTVYKGVSLADNEKITLSKTPDITGKFGIKPDITSIGLSFDTSTGTISGTPTKVASETEYIITFTSTSSDRTEIHTYTDTDRTIEILLTIEYKPKNKAELLEAIKTEVGLQGNTANLNIINTSLITDMSRLFKDNTTFNGDISKWNVSKVTDMSSMFSGATSFNGDISKWNVSKVTDMSSMFLGATSFNQNVSGWNVSKVADMSSMFLGATSFNQNVSGWNVSKVTNMSSMFSGASKFTQDLEGWNVAIAVTKTDIFKNTAVAKLPTWYFSIKSNSASIDVYRGIPLAKNEEITLSKTPDIAGNFSISPDITANTGLSFNTSTGTISGTPTKAVSQTSYTIQFTSSFTGSTGALATHTYTDRTITISVEIHKYKHTPNNIAELKQAITTEINAQGNTANLNIIDTSNITDMSDLFKDNTTFNGNISEWNVSKVTDMENMLSGAIKFNGDIENWNIASLKTKTNMFTNTAVAKLPTWYFSISASSNSIHEGVKVPITDIILTRTPLIAGSFSISPDIKANTGLDFDTRTGTISGTPTEAASQTSYTIQFTSSFTDSSGNPATYTYVDTRSITLSVAINTYLYTPNNKTELLENIKKEIEVQGNTANLNIINTSNITDMSNIFENKANFNGDISGWDVSSVTDMSNMFSGATSFNQNVSGWNVSKVADMSSMFLGASAFDKDLESWKVASDGTVTKTDMFKNTAVAKLPTWYFSISANKSALTGQARIKLGASEEIKVTKTPSIAGSFSISPSITTNTGLSFDSSSGTISGTPTKVASKTPYTIQFTSEKNGKTIYAYTDRTITITVTIGHKYTPTGKLELINNINTEIGLQGNTADLNIIDTSKIDDMSGLFNSNTTFNGKISEWDVSNVTDMSHMFNQAAAFNGDISGWNVSNVIDMSSMFYYAGSFNQDISNWKVQSVTNMNGMFWNATSFNQDISNWKVQNVNDMGNMFSGATSFNKDISGWNVGAVTDMNRMFLGAANFNSNMSGWDVRKVTNMTAMFSGATIFNKDISNWKVGKVTNMHQMFSSAAAFNQDISSWNISSVTDIGKMFLGATKFNQDLEDWNVASDGTVTKTDIFKNTAVAKLPTWYFSISASDNKIIAYKNIPLATDKEITLTKTPNITGSFSVSPDIAKNTGLDFDPSTGKISGTPLTAISKTEYTIQFTSKKTDGTVIHKYIDTDRTIKISVEIRRYKHTPNNKTELKQAITTEINVQGNEANLNIIDTSKITDMSDLFKDNITFNGDISEWDVNAVTNMSSMLSGANAFEKDLESWNVASGVTKTDMFKNTAVAKLPTWYFNISASNRSINTYVNVPLAKNKEITFTKTPDITGSFSISPDITVNTGLDFNTSTGTISGTPTKAASKTDYTIEFTSSFTDSKGNPATHKYTDRTIKISVTTSYKHTPSNKTELQKAVDDEIAAQGDTANLNIIDTSVITDMSNLFEDKANFNGDISKWNVSKVTNMSNMFLNANKFNGDISGWNVSAVTNMESLFAGAHAFNQDIKNWTVSKVINMRAMFLSAQSFNQDIKNWTVSKVTNMETMFNFASKFSANLENWNVKSSVIKTNMFESTVVKKLPTWYFSINANRTTITGYKDLSLSNTETITLTKTSNVTGSFSISPNITTNTGLNFDTNTGSISGTPTILASQTKYTIQFTSEKNGKTIHTYTDRTIEIHVTISQYKYTPSDKTELQKAVDDEINAQGNTANLNIIDTSAITDMSNIFSSKDHFNGNVSKWDVSKVTNMSSIFAGAQKFNGDISNWNVSSVTNMFFMFNNANAFNQDLESWNVDSGVTKTDMFLASAVKKLPTWYFSISANSTTISVYRDLSLLDSQKIILTKTPVITGSFSISPNITTNTGLNFDTSTGIISGTPTTVTSQTEYTIQFRSEEADKTLIHKYIDDRRTIKVLVTIKEYKHIPNNKAELQQAINTEITVQGNTPDLTMIDTSKIKDMSSLFSSEVNFNGNISRWNVSSVTNMSSMFFKASEFNQDITGWNVSKVTDMRSMFINASKFNQDITGWNVSKVTDMSNMFKGASVFNKELETWNVDKTVSKTNMFEHTAVVILPTWYFNISASRASIGGSVKAYVGVPLTKDKEVTLTKTPAIAGIFSISPDITADTGLSFDADTGKISGTPTKAASKTYTIEFTSKKSDGKAIHTYTDASRSKTISVTIEYKYTPQNKKKLEEAIEAEIKAQGFAPNLNMIDTSNITDMGGLFYDKQYFNGDVSLWNVSKVTDMSNMFNQTEFFNGDISKWNVGKVTNMNSMFYDAEAFNQDIGNWNVSNVANMRYMFYDADVFNQDIGNWNVSNVTDMSSMFADASVFNQNLSNWNVANSVIKTDMFKGTAVKNLPGWCLPAGNCR